MPNPYWIIWALILVAARITVYRSRTIQFLTPRFRYNSTPLSGQLTMRICAAHRIAMTPHVHYVRARQYARHIVALRRILRLINGFALY